MYPANYLQAVQTYQKSGLAYLQNLYCILANTNSKFKHFNTDYTGNLGSVITYEKPPRATVVSSLVAQFEDAVQRVQSISVNQPASVAFAFTSQELIFNIDPMDYMNRFGKAAINALGSKVESYLASDFIKYPYRFYGNGVQQVNTFGQLAEATAQFKAFGSVQNGYKGFLPSLTVPNIVNSGLNQFVMNRNEELANSWKLGTYANVEWYESNLLQVHYSGTEGVEQNELTVVSATQDAAGQYTSITFSGTMAENDSNSIKKYDRLYFVDGVNGFQNMRFLTFTGYQPTQLPVQFMSASDAASNSSNQVTVTLNPPLVVGSSLTDSAAINQAIQPGMKVAVVPSHTAGCLYSGNPHFLAMPKLPEQIPYPSSSEYDEETGVSIRHYYGTVFTQNQQGFIYDCVYGSSLDPDNSMAIINPI